jgi:hypothetical protein
VCGVDHGAPGAAASAVAAEATLGCRNLEFVEGGTARRRVARALCATALVVDFHPLNPLRALAHKHARIALVASHQESVVGEEQHAQVRQARALNFDDRLLAWRRTLSNGQEAHARVMRRVSQHVARGRKRHVVDPRVCLYFDDLLTHLLEAHVGAKYLGGL